MLAALAMYDLPELMPAWTLFWDFMVEMLHASGMRDVPNRLTWGDAAVDAWDSPNLLLGQACGYPFATRLNGKVDYVATFDFDLEDLPPGHYRSYLVTAGDDPAEGLADLEGARFAFNGRESQSGYQAALRAFAEAGLAGPDLEAAQASGSHRAAMAAVAAGKARFASIDSVSFALVLAHRPEEVAGLKVVAATPATPGLPLVTARLDDPEAAAHRVSVLRWALNETINAPALWQARDFLALKGAVVLPPEAYEAFAEPLPGRA